MIEQLNEAQFPLKKTNRIETIDMLRLTYINSWLLIDLDDVIADFAEFMCELMNEIGSQCTPSDYISYQFSDFHGLTHKDLCELIANEEVYVNLEPKKGAIKALSELRALGVRVAIVTARGAFRGAQAQTEHWLASWGAEYDRLKVVDPTKESKSDFYLSFGKDNILGLVDDAPHNLEDAESVGVRSIKLTQPWNKNHCADMEVASLSELVDVLKKK